MEDSVLGGPRDLEQIVRLSTVLHVFLSVLEHKLEHGPTAESSISHEISSETLQLAESLFIPCLNTKPYSWR